MRATSLMPGLLLAAVATVPTGAARAAADAPPLMPTRDTTVVYLVTPEGAPQAQSVRVYFRGGGSAMRIDGPPGPDGSPSGDMVLDRPSRTITVVLNPARSFMQIPEREEVRSPFVLDSTMRFTRTGTGSVAGLPCVNWAIVTPKGNATACVTGDGVVLSASGVDGQGARGRLVAQTVQYAPLDPSVFLPPPGFQRTAHPEAMGPGGAPGGGPPGPGGPPDGSQPGIAPGTAPGMSPGIPPGTPNGQ